MIESLEGKQVWTLHPTPYREIGILLPNSQRQQRTLHIQKDVLPYALDSISTAYICGEEAAMIKSLVGMQVSTLHPTRPTVGF